LKGELGQLIALITRWEGEGRDGILAETIFDTIKTNICNRAPSESGVEGRNAFNLRGPSGARRKGIFFLRKGGREGDSGKADVEVSQLLSRQRAWE